MKLKTLLLRLGTENLIKFIDNEIFSILNLRKTSIINQKNLTDIILKLNSEKDLLIKPEFRKIIINSLKENEAKTIGKFFNIKGKNFWKELNNIDFKNKKNLSFLFSIFDITFQEKIVTDLKENKENPINIFPNYSLFEHQIDVLNQTKELLKRPIKKVLLHMPTGSGKTRTAINLVCEKLKNEKNYLVIWLAHTEELCQQAHDEFNKAWSIIGNRPLESYKLFKNFRFDLHKINSGFVVMSLDYAFSATKKDQEKFFTLARNCKFVVMDEAHMAIAPSYKQVLDILVNRNTILIGLTATPGRAHIINNENQELATFFNKQKATLKIKNYDNPILYLQDEGYLAKIENEKLETSVDIKKIFTQTEINYEIERIKEGRDLSDKFVKKISSNEKRTNMIIEKTIAESKNPENKIIVFAGSLSTAVNIDKILKLENINCAVITGETNELERRGNIELFKNGESKLNILINFGVLTTGFDAPRANIAIIGRPTQSVTLYSQMVGRVMRGQRAGGKKICKIVTVKDPIYGFRDMSETFFYWEELWD